ncbi:hypothetical protein [Desulfomonile tiedjei]|uniref:Uncharacterized protein n=1 Tax=Desulfomonile tiedjei (strain ATCC 49306 / DSM 6799 / DCB-1) TaxID=706587 RepID=I4BZS9_DESTA|nr:hypothetical protein [Desulfomonile tiedjei]AFM22820.1 hypothetical protein Desti_0071 [Desulfomonile tiedjei DSM 6799]
MDELVKYSDVLVDLLFGVCCILAAAQFQWERRNTLTIIVWLLFGAAYVVLGLSNYMELMAPKWIGISREALVGIVGMWIGISALYGGSLPHFSRWTKWASLIVGAALLL